MKSKYNVKTMTLISLGIAINIVGAFIALGLKLPIYLDSIGTIMIAAILGPKYAIITGLCGSIVSGITFDIYSLYFAPVQISTGLLAGIMYKRDFLKGFKIPLGVFAFALPTSILSSIIASEVFGGITSSGSSYIVQLLSTFGMSKVSSILITQICTDYADKFIGVLLVNFAVSVLPSSYIAEHKNILNKGELNG